jgi:AcrR family transcriptional regulator
MSTRDTILAAALKVLEGSGRAHFSTRTVCALAKVTAPTLYHHFGSADGLLGAAMAEAFRQFLDSKRAAVRSSDPVTALREGWNDYVRFASARPRLFTAILGRVLEGAHIEGADQGNAALTAMVKAVAAEGRLKVPVRAAADLIWASANAAALLHAMAEARKAPRPEPAVVDGMREATLQLVLASKKKARER